MKAADVISTLQARGIKLWQDGGTLRYRAPAGALTERERAALRAHKPAILRALSQPTPTTAGAPVSPALAVTEPADKREAYEERAAIMEYDGGLTMREAEQKAGTCYYCRRWHGTRSGNGYCCIGFAPPIPRQAGDTCEQFEPDGNDLQPSIRPVLTGDKREARA